MRRIVFACSLTLPLLLSLVACTGDDDAEPNDPPSTTSSSGGGGGSSSGGSSGGGGYSGDPAPYGDRLDQLDTDKFTFIEPGGDTRCSLDTAYGFAVRPGDPNKVIIEFEGGGACWNASTCNRPAGSEYPIYKSEVDGAHYAGKQPGLRDHENAANPLKGWTHVIVPYCTGDIHWGDKVTEHSATRTVHHRGAVNTKAVLDYLYSQVKSPERLFVTGCSAGGYGSIYWTPAVRAHYASARVHHLSDSAAGVIPDGMFDTLQGAWNFTENFASGIGDIANFQNLKFVYAETAAAYPDVTLSQFNTYADTTQGLFYSTMGGQGWQNGMKANLSGLIADVPKFRNYLSDGDQHCIIDRDNFYTKEIAGTKLTDWVGKIANDQDVENVACDTCEL